MFGSMMPTRSPTPMPSRWRKVANRDEAASRSAYVIVASSEMVAVRSGIRRAVATRLSARLDISAPSKPTSLTIPSSRLAGMRRCLGEQRRPADGVPVHTRVRIVRRYTASQAMLYPQTAADIAHQDENRPRAIDMLGASWGLLRPIRILRLPHEKSMNLERQGDLGDVPRSRQGTAGSLFDSV